MFPLKQHSTNSKTENDTHIAYNLREIVWTVVNCCQQWSLWYQNICWLLHFILVFQLIDSHNKGNYSSFKSLCSVTALQWCMNTCVNV